MQDSPLLNVAAAMALGSRRVAQTDWALSVTGVAGPGGGAPNKPVGLVYLGLADPAGAVRCARQTFLGGRAGVRFQSTQAALDLLRRGLMQYPLEGEVDINAE